MVLGMALTRLLSPPHEAAGAAGSAASSAAGAAHGGAVQVAVAWAVFLSLTVRLGCGKPTFNIPG
jgi:hypothetical protein